MERIVWLVGCRITGCGVSGWVRSLYIYYLFYMLRGAINRGWGLGDRYLVPHVHFATIIFEVMSDDQIEV